MNIYLEPSGFLGTGASLLADITLVAYLLLIIPAMVIGFIFARQGKHRPQHRNAMTFVTVANWVLIVFLMLMAYRFDIAENIGRAPGNLRYLLPTIHGLLGLPAQILATFIIVRMAVEDRAVAAAKTRGETRFNQYWWTGAKRTMQVTLALWFATAALGVVSYAIRYNVLPTSGAPADLITVATEEPVATDEAMMTTDEMVATDEVVVTDEASPTARPAALTLPTRRPPTPPNATEEAIAPVSTDEANAPVVTPEADPEPDDDSSGQGRGRGRGRGGDDDEDSNDDDNSGSGSGG